MNQEFKPIPRSNIVFPEEDFNRLYNIHKDNPWLLNEDIEGFYHLWQLAQNEEQID